MNLSKKVPPHETIVFLQWRRFLAIFALLALTRTDVVSAAPSTPPPPIYCLPASRAINERTDRLNKELEIPEKLRKSIDLLAKRHKEKRLHWPPVKHIAADMDDHNTLEYLLEYPTRWPSDLNPKFRAALDQLREKRETQKLIKSLKAGGDHWPPQLGSSEREQMERLLAAGPKTWPRDMDPALETAFAAIYKTRPKPFSRIAADLMSGKELPKSSDANRHYDYRWMIDEFFPRNPIPGNWPDYMKANPVVYEAFVKRLSEMRDPVSPSFERIATALAAKQELPKSTEKGKRKIDYNWLTKFLKENPDPNLWPDYIKANTTAYNAFVQKLQHQHTPVAVGRIEAALAANQGLPTSTDRKADYQWMMEEFFAKHPNSDHWPNYIKSRPIVYDAFLKRLRQERLPPPAFKRIADAIDSGKGVPIRSDQERSADYQWMMAFFRENPDPNLWPDYIKSKPAAYDAFVATLQKSRQRK